MAILRDANLDAVETLFDDMITEDAEMAKLKLLPDINDLLHEYRDMFTEAVNEFKTEGLAEYERKKAEKSSLERALARLRKQSQKKTIDIVLRFDEQKRVLLKRAQQLEMETIPLLDDLLQENGDMLDLCMEIEIKQVDIFNNLVDTWEGAMQQIRSESSEGKMNFWRALADYEKDFSEAVKENASALQEKLATGEAEDNLSEEAKILLGSDDTLSTAIDSSRENHVGMFYAREEEMNVREEALFKEQQAEYRDGEYQRNRDRVAEITNMIEKNKVEIEKMKLEIEQAEEYDDGL